MKKYKTYKRLKYVTKSEEVEVKMPYWYYRFLLWLFGHEEDIIDSILLQERTQAWTKGYSDAQNSTHSVKEELMQKKLYELGYEVKSNFPQARLHPDISSIPDQQYDQNKLFEIVKVG